MTWNTYHISNAQILSDAGAQTQVASYQAPTASLNYDARLQLSYTYSQPLSDQL